MGAFLNVKIGISQAAFSSLRHMTFDRENCLKNSQICLSQKEKVPL